MRADLLGCPIDVLTMDETLDRARLAMQHRMRLQHTALNVAKFVRMRSNQTLARDVTDSDLVGIDGMGIVLAARCLGIPVKERVAGIDLLTGVLALCEREGFRPYFLGATSQVLRKAVSQSLKKHPALQFAGFHDGYFTPAEEPTVVRRIIESGADCLFIGMPTPRKERFLAEYRSHLGVPFIMGVGGSFDVLAGEVRRAPQLMQRLGFEWLYRVYQEPRRMWWRYLETNVVFASILLRLIVRRFVARA
jgi:N-acetylglucosaminyldiphosphoundecaprenol N-acetyl-beta-D-mannosaminyltransferase